MVMPWVTHIPGLKLVSELNQREHHQVRSKRRKAERRRVDAALTESWAAFAPGQPRPEPPLHIRVVRLCTRRPGITDADNLVSSAKACRDQAAEWLGIDDKDVGALKFEVCQEVAADKRWGTRIEMRGVLEVDSFDALPVLWVGWMSAERVA